MKIPLRDLRKTCGEAFQSTIGIATKKKKLHSDTSPEYTAGLATGQAEADEVTDG